MVSPCLSRGMAGRVPDRVSQASGTRYRLTRRHRVPLASAVGVVAVAAGAVVFLQAKDQPVDRSASVIAVVPFTPSLQDTGLVRLGRDLAVTLSANFDGVDELRTVDMLPLLARDDGESRTGEQAAGLARGLGASMVVRGQLVRSGGRVRADAALFLELDAVPAARASATASPEDLVALTDSLTWALLRQLWRTRAPPTPSLEVITTHSIPALRAFLEGERFVTQGRYSEAVSAFSGAIEADSTFWFAYWEYAKAHLERPVAPQVSDAIIAHRFELPERDRLLIETSMGEGARLTVRLARLRAVTERYREYWPAWWAYANALVHQGPVVGFTHAESRAALERTIVLNPGLHTAWQHLFWLSAQDCDTLTAGRSLRELVRLGFHTTSIQATGGVSEMLVFRYVDHLMRSDGRIDPALADDLAVDLAESRPAMAADHFDSILMHYGFPKAEVDLAHRILRRQPAAGLAASKRRSVALAWAARGAWIPRWSPVKEYANSTPEPAATLYAYRLAVIGHWQEAVRFEDVRRWRSALTPELERLVPAQRAELAWLDGLVAATARDRAALATARASLAGTDTLTAPLLDRSLAAMDLALAGNRGQAARAVVALEHERAESSEIYRLSDHHPYLTPVHRLMSSRWLRAEGDAAGAAALLAWHELVPWPLPQTAAARAMLGGIFYLERARIEEAAGRSDFARGYYQQFLRRYDLPVAGHRHLVEEARSAMARLGGSSNR